MPRYTVVIARDEAPTLYIDSAEAETPEAAACEVAEEMREDDTTSTILDVAVFETSADDLILEPEGLVSHLNEAQRIDAAMEA